VGAPGVYDLVESLAVWAAKVAGDGVAVYP
jgi:hypothetical protein